MKVGSAQVQHTAAALGPLVLFGAFVSVEMSGDGDESLRIVSVSENPEAKVEFLFTLK